MPLNFNWALYDNNNAGDFPDDDFGKAVDFLKLNAEVHKNLDKDILKRAITTDDENDVNWVKMSIGKDNLSNVCAVIFYHLLKHREKVPSANARQWSISVGFDETLVNGHLNGNPNNPDNLYVQLATEINKGITKAIDQTSSGFQPPVTSLLWIDDIEVPNKERPPVYVVETEAQLREKPIGELGWIAAHNKDIRREWPIWSVSMLDAPTTPDGTHLGYGRVRGQVYVTEVVRKK